MKVCTLIVFSHILMLSATPSAPPSHGEMIDYAKALPAGMLDESLPQTILHEWLLKGPPKVDEVNWRISLDCDLKDPGKPRPVCVKFVFRRGKISGWGLLRTGTSKRLISGKPQLMYVVVSLEGGGADSPTPFWTSDKLSDLPLIMDRIR